MASSDKPTGDMDPILRDIYLGAEPADSWEQLRERVDAAVSRGHRSAQVHGKLVFWRRVALALAACVILTTALLFRAWLSRPSGALSDPPLLTEMQAGRLVEAFAQVRDLFSAQNPWFAVDSAGDSRIGVSPRKQADERGQRAIVIRLALRDGRTAGGQAYTDLVLFPEQEVSIEMRTAEGSAIDVSVLPALHADGGVTLSVTAYGGDKVRTVGAASVDPDGFRPLLRLRAGSRWVSLGATARAVPVVEQG